MSEEKTEQKKDKIELTTEEIESLQKDIDSALSKYKSDKKSDEDKIKEETRKEVEKELTMKHELEAKEKELEELKKKQVLEQQKTQAELQAMKEKMDSMISSKQVVNAKNPFKENNMKVEDFSNEQVEDIEKESERVFFEQRGK